MEACRCQPLTKGIRTSTAPGHDDLTSCLHFQESILVRDLSDCKDWISYPAMMLKKFLPGIQNSLRSRLSRAMPVMYEFHRSFKRYSTGCFSDKKIFILSKIQALGPKNFDDYVGPSGFTVNSRLPWLLFTDTAVPGNRFFKLEAAFNA